MITASKPNQTEHTNLIPSVQFLTRTTSYTTTKMTSRSMRNNSFGITAEGKQCKRCMKQGGLCWQHVKSGREQLKSEGTIGLTEKGTPCKICSKKGGLCHHNHKRFIVLKSDGSACERCVERGEFCELHGGKQNKTTKTKQPMSHEKTPETNGKADEPSPSPKYSTPKAPPSEQKGSSASSHSSDKTSSKKTQDKRSQEDDGTRNSSYGSDGGARTYYWSNTMPGFNDEEPTGQSRSEQSSSSSSSKFNFGKSSESCDGKNDSKDDPKKSDGGKKTTPSSNNEPKTAPPAKQKKDFGTLGLLDRNSMVYVSDLSCKAIRRAYRELALKLHPDKNKEDYDPAKFHEVQNAYEALSLVYLQV